MIISELKIAIITVVNTTEKRGLFTCDRHGFQNQLTVVLNKENGHLNVINCRLYNSSFSLSNITLWPAL